MTKNQKTLIGVGVLAVAGYLVYQNQTKKQNFLRSTSFRGEGTIRKVAVCKYSSAGYKTITMDGETLHQCCGADTWGRAAGPTPCKDTTIVAELSM